MDRSFNPAIPDIIEARPHRFPWVNVVLFAATCASTSFVGAFLMASFRDDSWEHFTDGVLHHPLGLLLSGLPFSMAIMSILFSHEMGHYLTCRYYGIDASLPYFIPFPTLVGTMGAFIRIRAPIRDRGSLLEMGIAGPIAGFIVAVAVLMISIPYGRFVDPATMQGGFQVSDPLILKLTQHLLGVTPPQGMDTYMHPASLAAWFGFFVTALNLLPAAQLDGGHVIYAIFPRHHRWISFSVAALLIPLAIFYWVGWGLWIVILLILRLYHPPTVNNEAPIQTRHIVLGLIGLALFILCFTPAPFVLN
jgi:membrane-associated protease RseP (regulator of RpoE activity)